MVLERLKPGTPLSQVADDAGATSIAARLMRELWRTVPANHTFPTIREWADGLKQLRPLFGGGTGPFPEHLVRQAETLFEELLDTMSVPVLLHGDLHHDNILAAERRPWLAIDPKGVVGEREYEVGAFMRNPLPRLLRDPQLARTLARRADQFADELGFDRKRILAWSFAQAVLAAWWAFEDTDPNWQQWLVCAGTLSALQ